MKRLGISLLLICVPVAAAEYSYGKLPLSFEPNQGQTDASMKFLARVPGYTFFVSENDAVFAGRDGSVERMKLVGANPKVRIEGLEKQPGISNYFIGNDPSKWRANIPNYGKVALREVYPGIDLIFYGNDRQLEYDWVVAPGSDPKQIRVKWEGSSEITTNASGDLLLSGALRQKKPVIIQEGKPIEGGYIVLGNEVGIVVAKYDATKTLVIDPALLYSTYLGGSGTDVGTGIAVDSSGNAYVTGYTNSTNFPTTTPLQASSGGGGFNDVFVTKINAAGSARVYSTYLGGSTIDQGQGIAVDTSGNAYVTGYTSSLDFPTVNPVQPSLGGFEDAFVTKINAAGSALVYSTYLGGGNLDQGQAIAVDGLGNAYVTGLTTSTNFPTATPLQASNGGGYDAFVTKINAAGSARVYSTYLGGTGTDIANAIAVDTLGNAVVTGNTNSTDFPTATPIQAANGGGEDVFVTKINAAGTAYVYSTYLGAGGDDRGQGVAVDGSGNAYVTGRTSSFSFPTINSLQSGDAGGIDAFVTKYNAAGSAMVYSTYLGGGDLDQAQAIAVDGSGNVFVTGYTISTNFPTTNPLQASGGGAEDAFVTEINAAGSAYVYSTYLGGNGTDVGNGIAVFSGKAYVTGQTASTNFPIGSPFQASNGGGVDAFVVSIISSTVPVAVPNVVGFTKAAAANAITGANLVTGAVTTVSSNTATVGSVISQNPTAGTMVTPGSAVSLVLAGSQPISVAPSVGSAGRQLFSFVARHASGANNIQYAQFLFSKSGISALNGCYISYDPAANVFYLLSDDLTQWYGLVGGSANTIGNAQCTIYGATSGSTKVGTDLTTHVDISFRTGFSGLKTISQFSGDTLGNGSGWQTMGTWNDTGDPTVVELISLTPNSGTGFSQVFTAVTRDSNGATTIPFVQFVMNAGLSGVNGCFIHYDRASNVFFLLNDGGTAFAGLVAGSATQVSNSQCTLHGVGSGGTAVGSDLTVTYKLDFSGSFTGTKEVFMQAVDNTGVIEVWHQMGTWAP